VESHDGNAYRAVYTVRFERPCMSSTRFRRNRRLASEPRSGIDLVAERLKTAERDYEEHYDKPKR
jgi:hypothetical protein